MNATVTISQYGADNQDLTWELDHTTQQPTTQAWAKRARSYLAGIRSMATDATDRDDFLRMAQATENEVIDFGFGVNIVTPHRAEPLERFIITVRFEQ